MVTPQGLVASFNRAKDVFADGWGVGTYQWLQTNAIGATVRIALAEQQLDAVWLKTKAGQATVAEFDAALETWKQAHVDALKEFQARSGQ